MFDNHMGTVLHSARLDLGEDGSVEEKMSRDDLARRLSVRTKKLIPSDLVEKMEEGFEEISEDLLDAWCDVLEIDKIKILKAAQALEERSDWSGDELLQEIIDEEEYEDWKNQQES